MATENPLGREAVTPPADRAGSAERAVIVDASGQRCPLPVIALAKRARELAPGTLVVVIATDPAARLDVPAWARLRGHDVVDVEETSPGTSWRLAVRIGTGGSPRAS